MIAISNAKSWATYKSSFLSLVNCGHGRSRKSWKPIGILKSKNLPIMLLLLMSFSVPVPVFESPTFPIQVFFRVFRRLRKILRRCRQPESRRSNDLTASSTFASSSMLTSTAAIMDFLLGVSNRPKITRIWRKSWEKRERRAKWLDKASNWIGWTRGVKCDWTSWRSVLSHLPPKVDHCWTKGFSPRWTWQGPVTSSNDKALAHWVP